MCIRDSYSYAVLLWYCCAVRAVLQWCRTCHSLRVSTYCTDLILLPMIHDWWYWYRSTMYNDQLWLRAIQYRISLCKRGKLVRISWPGKITRNATRRIRRAYRLHTWLKCTHNWTRNANNYQVCRTIQYKADCCLSHIYQATVEKQVWFVIS